MTKSARFPSWMLLLFFLVLMNAPAHARMIDGIVAVVDNNVIMDSDLRRKMIELGTTEDNKAAERQVLELMVEEIVIGKIYTSFGLPPVNESEAKKVAEQMQCPLDTAKSYMMRNTLMDIMVRSKVVITDNMIKNYYESHGEYKGRESIRLKQIVVKNDDEKMKKVLEEIKAGMSFDDAAGNYSDALSAKGPDIGWIAVEDLSNDVLKHIKGAKPGDLLGPVSTSGSTILYQLVEKGVVGERKLDEVKDEIRKTLVKKYQDEAFNYWLHKMMTQYFIGIYI